jgi:hypothetical protein
LSLNGIFQFLRYDSVKCHTCFIFNQTFLLNTMLFLLFQMLQMTADEIILNCKCLVLQSHLDAMLKKSVTLIPKTSNTISHNSFEIKHSKNKCLTYSISLQRLHSRGFGIPLFLKLSLVITLKSKGKPNSRGIFNFHTAGRKFV